MWVATKHELDVLCGGWCSIRAFIMVISVNVRNVPDDASMKVHVLERYSHALPLCEWPTHHDWTLNTDRELLVVPRSNRVMSLVS